MTTNTIDWPKHRASLNTTIRAFKRSLQGGCWFVMPVLIFLAAGCSSSKIDAQRDNAAFETPALFTGPALALVTNTSGFTAKVQIQTPGSKGPHIRTGRLIGLDSRFLLVFDHKKSLILKKEAASETTFFIWDVNQGRGFVLNEALQGYAPYSVAAHVTTVKVEDSSVYDKLGGYRSQRGEASAVLSDGSTTRFTVFRAKDLNNFPVQIKLDNGQCIVTFSDVKFERVSPGVFTPPDGFTAHQNPSAMLGTLMERQFAVKKTTIDPEDKLPDDAGFSRMGH